jgi:hypothetical protein
MLGGDYETMPLLSGLVGTHWPNFLHEDPTRNLETVARAEAYFRRCGSQFGTVLSRDVAFFVTQAMYHRYATAYEDDAGFTVDVTNVPLVEGMNGSFCISTKQPIVSCDGCTAEVYENHPTHTVYEIKPKAKILRLFL